ncbi:MAG: hypothetical protein KGI58_01695 [Patescibacteria group bacterium]|nr:hypothetical protein [Patescibacteria group bacterium]
MQRTKHKKTKGPTKVIFHPFLYTNGKDTYNIKHMPVIGLDRVKANRHHLYPKKCEDIPEINKEKFLLRLWEYKHFQGWNILFQFCYLENGIKKNSELTIDEIITLMIIKHPFITKKVGSKAWKILFKENNLNQACDILCRMLAWKFNHKHTWKKSFPSKIEFAVEKMAA